MIHCLTKLPSCRPNGESCVVTGPRSIRIRPQVPRPRRSFCPPSRNTVEIRKVVRSFSALQEPGTEQLRHQLPDGTTLEVLFERSHSTADAGALKPKPPLVFLHGSFASAWVWKEYFLPYFANLGYDAYALSLRGQGGSEIAPGQSYAGTPLSHAQDIAHFVASLDRPPALIAHSLSGLFIEKYASEMASSSLPPVAGMAFLCAAPPTGNAGLVKRLVQKNPVMAFKVTWLMVAKSFRRSADATREVFFSEKLPTADLVRYQQQMATCGDVGMVDVRTLNSEFPLEVPSGGVPPAFVLGGDADWVVDEIGVKETAAWFGVAPVILPGLAHYCMLDTQWKRVARLLEEWLVGL